MTLPRHKTKTIKIGNINIGGNHPVAIQSMAKYKTSDIKKVVQQINELERCGCEIVRLAIKDSEDALALKSIKRQVHLPLVADIHFNWNLALEAIENGADKIRLNPGNIYKKAEIEEIVSALKLAKIPLRIGLNSGSVKSPNSKNMRMADKLVLGALNYIKIIEKMGYYDMVVSLKASTVADTIEAYRKMAKICSYPLHLGVTATGLPDEGAIKSAIAIGTLLLEGIGDTVRVSLTAKPEEEVKVARLILKASGSRSFGPEVISCPTCGRCEIDLIRVVKDLENKLSTADSKAGNRQPKVAVMGCVVNGPGEGKVADIGIAFGKKEGLLFRRGKPIKKVSFSSCVSVLLAEMRGIK